jgi:hypothetical protein
MWITQTAFLETQKALMSAIAQRDAVKAQQAAMTATNEWLMARVTQLEYERAAMIKANYGVEVKVPTIARVPDDISGLDLNHTISFNDVGDAEAEKMGIGWNHDGTLTYSQPTE